MKETKITKQDFDIILKENERLKKENESMQKVLDSKRFKMAERVANTYNAILPEGTRRRKVLMAASFPIRKIAQYRQNANVRRVEKIIGKNKKVIKIHSITWNTPLRQRPHHLAKCLAEHENVVVVYFEPDEQIKNYREIKNNFVTVNSWEIIFKLKHDNTNKYYFFFNNVSNIPFKTIREIDDKGYKIVYEYIDEFHEDISGSLMNQLETWNGLQKMKPYIVLASANKLYNEAKKHFKNVKVIMSKNAVNVEDFDFHNFENEKMPSDLVKIIKNKKPIVGYYGALAPWLDYKLIANTAKNYPQYDFVLLGVNYQDALKNLDLTINNISYLGPKKYSELPEYSSHFDVAIIPFKTGEIAKGTSPVKLFEYMAMGIPTVGTKDLDECKGFKYVYLAKDSKDFGEKLGIAIKEHADNKVKIELLKQAEENSWTRRADDIIKEL